MHSVRREYTHYHAYTSQRGITMCISDGDVRNDCFQMHYPQKDISLFRPPHLHRLEFSRLGKERLIADWLAWVTPASVVTRGAPPAHATPALAAHAQGGASPLAHQ